MWMSSNNSCLFCGFLCIDDLGNLLEDDGLVATLENVIRTSGEVKGRLSEAMTTSGEISASRLKYEEVSSKK